MKRFAAFVCAAIMTAVMAVSFMPAVFAESTAYEINELNMSIPIPDDMITLTRDSKENDEFFKTFKQLNYDTTMAQLNEANIYLEAVNKDTSLTLTVTMTRTEDSVSIGSYNSLSDEELAGIMKKLRANKAYKDASPVEYKDVKYICLNMSFKSGKKTVQAQQYNTVMNGENINITMQAAPGKKLTTANKETLTGIIKETTILNDTFFNRNKTIILYGSITLGALAIIIVAFILIRKYIRNPDRKHKILVHELAHEHKISETTAIPRKHIMDVIKPTNSFLTKYDPVDEIGKKKKKKKETAPDEIREIKSFSEPVPEEAQEAPITEVSYDEPNDEIVVPIEEAEVEKAAAEAETEAVEAEAAVEEVEETEEVEEAVEAVEEEEDVPAEEPKPEVQEAVQSEENFEEAADYFDDVPEEKEMYSYTDVDEAVSDYSAAKGYDSYDEEEEEYESVSENTVWETVKKVLLAIGSGLLIGLKALGKGLVIVFKAIFRGLAYFFTHAKYFFTNLYRMIKRSRAEKKRRRAEEERRRQASERRRMQREAERARQRNNANRGENDLVQVRSSYDRRPVQQSTRQRSDRQRSDSRRRAEDYRRSDRSRSSRPRR